MSLRELTGNKSCQKIELAGWVKDLTHQIIWDRTKERYIDGHYSCKVS